MEYTKFINWIEMGIFPREQWNHLAHLRLALYYLFLEKDFYRALSKTRCTLIRFNSISQEHNRCAERYSETITIFWVKELFKILNQNKDASLVELERLLLASELVRFDYIYGFYTKELLESSSSKALFIEPDID